MQNDKLRWLGTVLICLNIITAPWFLPYNYYFLVIGNGILGYNSIKYRDVPMMTLSALMVSFGTLTLILN